jgi:two-component system sensor histidine kinase YesM
LLTVEDAARKFAYNPFVRQYLKTDQIKVKFELKNYLESIINDTLEDNNEISAFALIEDESWRNFYGNLDYPIYQEIMQQINLRSLTLKKGRFITIKTSSKVIYAYLLPIFAINDNSLLNQRLGSVLLLLSQTSIDNILNEVAVNNYTSFFLLNQENQVIAANNNSLANRIQANNYADYKKNDNFIIQTAKIDAPGWKLSAIILKKEVTADLSIFPMLIVFSGLILISLLSAIALILDFNITRPITNLALNLEQIGNKYLDERIELETAGELNIIVEDTNKMLDKIETLSKTEMKMQKQIYESQLSRQQAELSALQSQINPHFLYNTLECMRSIAAVYESQEIVDISTAMADIFRYNIKANNLVTFAEELEIIKSYLKIMELRFPDKFKFEFKIEEAILSRQIIKMTLQPLVENAIYHGLESRRKAGKLLLEAKTDAQNIIFKIKDNGLGIAEPELANLNKKLTSVLELKKEDLQTEGIGLLNINKRIKLYYGLEYGLTISSNLDQGTEVIVEIPLAKSKGDL